MTVPALGSGQLQFPVSCPLATAVGDCTLTCTFDPGDPAATPRSGIGDVRILGNRRVTFTSDLLSPMTLLHPSSTSGELQLTVSGGPATISVGAQQLPAGVLIDLPRTVDVDGTVALPITLTVTEVPTGFDDNPQPVELSYFVPADQFHPDSTTGTFDLVDVILPMEWRRIPSGDLGPSTVTGNATLLIQQDGLTHFVGHVHDSGFFGESYTFTMAFLDVKDDQNRAPVFAHPGDLSGTVGGGPIRSDDWDIPGPDDQEHKDFIRDNWQQIRTSRVHSELDVSTDPGGPIEVIVAGIVAAVGITVFILYQLGKLEVSCQAAVEGGPDSLGLGVICIITFK